MNEPRPSPAGFVVPRAKIVDYLLNVHHPRGGAKARFFLAFGFSPERPSEFAAALVAHVRPSAAPTPGAIPAGPMTFVFEGPVPSPDGRNPGVRSVWVVPSGGDVARLVTAVPMSRGRGAADPSDDGTAP